MPMIENWCFRSQQYLRETTVHDRFGNGWKEYYNIGVTIIVIKNMFVEA
jgi:hypothetical protein